MKKYEFDNEPQMLEQEGSMMRISFDVESQQKEFPSMSGDEPVVRTIYLAHVTRVPMPLNADTIASTLVADGFSQEKADVVATQTMFVAGGSSDLELAKAFVIAKITEYDCSTAVNEFSINGDPMWLPDAKRTQVSKRFNTDEGEGLTDTKIINEGKVYELPIATARQMMLQLEIYAKHCYDKTEEHKAAVNALKTVKAVCNYDYTAGYPPKLAF